MRNYEIVFLVHPDQSDQTSSIISKLEKSVNDSGGNVHRAENIGNRKLAYPIQDQFKASYGLLNIECNQETIDEIKSSFKFNDSIIRNLILSVNKVHKDTSALLTQTKEDNEKDSYQEAREAANKAVDQEAQAASKPVSSADVTKSDKPKDTKEEVKEEAE
jgi:small subunit ribosomal protein S6|tara:strand:+ start:1777 stop:2259 length:483 start_codon:yes stop_codon:yes gene_type:complete